MSDGKDVLLHVQEVCDEWISVGAGEECFWEHWPKCPSGHKVITPFMVKKALHLAEMAGLDARNNGGGDGEG